MSDEPLEPLASDLQDLLRAERGREPLSADASARIQSHLASSIGAFGPSPMPMVHDAGVAGAGLSAKLLPLLTATFVLGAVAGSALTWTLTQRESIAPREDTHGVERGSEPAHEVKAPVVPAAPLAQEVTAPPLEVIHDAHPVDAGARVVTSDPDRDLAAERSLMEQARSSLAHSRWNDALLALDKHRSRFSRGKLAEERDSMRVPTLVMLGRYDDARAAAQRFHTRYPTSIFASGVDQAVRSIP